jgi:hypothetical protein
MFPTGAAIEKEGETPRDQAEENKRGKSICIPKGGTSKYDSSEDEGGRRSMPVPDCQTEKPGSGQFTS